MRRLLLATLALSVLAACGSDVAREEVRLCRLTLPVLNPDGATIRVLRAVEAGERAVRVDYVVEGVGRARQRWALCRFSPSPLVAGRPDLVAIETDEGEVSGASLYLMQRFWLDTPDALEADPGAGAG